MRIYEKCWTQINDSYFYYEYISYEDRSALSQQAELNTLGSVWSVSLTGLWGLKPELEVICKQKGEISQTQAHLKSSFVRYIKDRIPDLQGFTSRPHS